MTGMSRSVQYFRPTSTCWVGTRVLDEAQAHVSVRDSWNSKPASPKRPRLTFSLAPAKAQTPTLAHRTSDVGGGEGEGERRREAGRSQGPNRRAPLRQEAPRHGRLRRRRARQVPPPLASPSPSSPGSPHYVRIELEARVSWLLSRLPRFCLNFAPDFCAINRFSAYAFRDS